MGVYKDLNSDLTTFNDEIAKFKLRKNELKKQKAEIERNIPNKEDISKKGIQE